MPIIRVSCLPKVKEKKLRKLHKSIVAAVVGIAELGVKDQYDITCLFPTDMMKYGLGDEIIIEVIGLFKKKERNEEVRQRLAQDLGLAVRDHFPTAHLVECLIESFDPRQGYWSSRTSPAKKLVIHVFPDDTIDLVAQRMVDQWKPHRYSYAIFNGVELESGGGDDAGDIVAKYYTAKGTNRP